MNDYQLMIARRDAMTKLQEHLATKDQNSLNKDWFLHKKQLIEKCITLTEEANANLLSEENLRLYVNPSDTKRYALAKSSRADGVSKNNTLLEEYREIIRAIDKQIELIDNINQDLLNRKVGITS